jgi:large subunit ribosomal protein L10
MGESLCHKLCEAKTFCLKGGEVTLAISKERKEELVKQYEAWANGSKAMIVTEYLGLSMKQIDDLRAKARAAGGEFHIIKNTLAKVAFEKAGLPASKQMLEGSSAVLFAFENAPDAAKMINEFARTSDFVKVKGGYLDGRCISARDVTSLAELPPLPVVRGQLLGTILAPASKLARTLAEPARQMAAVLKAYADQEAAASAA